MATLKTPLATLSFPHLFTPDEFGDTPKYSATFVFDADAQNTDEFQALKDAAAAAAKERFGAKASKAKSPFIDCDTDDGWPEGSVQIRCRSTSAPQVVGKLRDGDTGKLIPITDEEAVYGGCKVYGAVSAFAYDTNGNRGVSFALVGVQKWDDGERLGGGGGSVDDIFGDAGTAGGDDDLF